MVWHANDVVRRQVAARQVMVQRSLGEFTWRRIEFRERRAAALAALSRGTQTWPQCSQRCSAIWDRPLNRRELNDADRSSNQIARARGRRSPKQIRARRTPRRRSIRRAPRIDVPTSGRQVADARGAIPVGQPAGAIALLLLVHRGEIEPAVGRPRDLGVDFDLQLIRPQQAGPSQLTERIASIEEAAALRFEFEPMSWRPLDAGRAHAEPILSMDVAAGGAPDCIRSPTSWTVSASCEVIPWPPLAVITCQC